MKHRMHPAVTNGGYDVDRVRADFPILGHEGLRQAAGLSRQRRLGAEAAGGARPHRSRPTPREYANVHRGLHYLANAATEAYEGAREKVRGFLNAERTEEIIFTRNATEAINLVAYTFGRERIKAGRRDRALDHGASLQHRAVAFPARAAGRGDQMGAGRRRRQFPHRRIREAADRRAPRWSRSPTCRTCSAPSCR